MTTKDIQNIKYLYEEERYSYASIGRLYKVSRQRVHQIIKNYKSFSGSGHSYAYLPELSINLRCKKCNKQETTHIHHIDRNSRNNKPDNLIQLCISCHKKIHKP